MSTDHAREKHAREEPASGPIRPCCQITAVVIVALIAVAIPIVWNVVSGEELTPASLAPWVSAAGALAAVTWAMLRAVSDDRRRADDLRRMAQQRSDDQAREQALQAATVIPLVHQGRLRDSLVALDVEVRNTGQHTVLQVSVDALWLTTSPVVHDAGHYTLTLDGHPPHALQTLALEPGAALRTCARDSLQDPPIPDVAAQGGAGRGGSFTDAGQGLMGFTFRTSEPMAMSADASINPVGDVVAVISFLDQHGQRWCRSGLEPPTPVGDDAPPHEVPDAVCLWPWDPHRGPRPTITTRSPNSP